MCLVVILCHHFVFPRSYLIGPYHNRPCYIRGYFGGQGVHFDVFGLGIGDLVRAGPLLWMSVDTGDGDWLLVTMAALPLTGGSRRCGWLQFVKQGAGPVAPPISVCARTVVLSHGGWVICI